MESTADSLGIAEQNIGNETIRDFVKVVNTSENLQANLATMAHDPGSARLESLDPGGWTGASSEAQQVEPKLPEKYENAENVMRAVVAMLKDGVGGEKVDPQYLVRTLSAGIGRYGLKVVPMQEGVDFPPLQTEETP